MEKYLGHSLYSLHLQKNTNYHSYYVSKTYKRYECPNYHSCYVSKTHKRYESPRKMLRKMYLLSIATALMFIPLCIATI